jgi:ubiquinone/menaquinone biosynthesis C-methylase UbiE
MSTLNQRIQKRYNRISGIYDTMDQMIRASWRRELLRHVHGRVLEVGVGTGANLPFYPENAEVIGVDFSRGMLNRARKKLEKSPNNRRICLKKADIQHLPFPDHTFDFVVSTCVFCSVPDPVLGLREIKRVCKPDGRILMLEHMRSKNPVVGFLMDLLNPLTVRLWGANINRRTMDNIRRAGLTVFEEKPLFYSILKKLTLRP